VDIKAYIESGVIEAYVLGLATSEEAAELEMLRKQYAEVNEAIVAFENHLENTAYAEAQQPPAFIKQKLNEQLAGEFRSNESGRIVEMPKYSSSSVKPFWKYIAAASVILLIVSSVLNFYLYNQYQTADTGYKQLLAQQTTLIANNNVINTKLNAMNESLRIMTDPAVLSVSMPSTSTNNYRATVYWDTKTKDVYLLSNNLPEAPTGKQYQLWALVDGKPVDAGIMDECAGLCHMKVIDKADAFAITLEKQGGSPTPDLSQLYVLGKI
jgi:anti-sigma-K factor RskA